MLVIVSMYVTARNAERFIDGLWHQDIEEYVLFQHIVVQILSHRWQIFTEQIFLCMSRQIKATEFIQTVGLLLTAVNRKQVST